MRKQVGLTSAFVALFAAFICVGCFLRIPVGVVPIVLQNAICILCAILLGGWKGFLPCALWLLAGIIGLPVYSGGTGGFVIWMGPTGGFLLGYFIGAIAASFIAGKPSVSEKKLNAVTVIRVSVAAVVGMVLIYVPGIMHFAHWAVEGSKVPEGKTVLSYAMAACCLPYIPGDIIKTVVIIPVALKIRPVLAQYLYCKPSDLEQEIVES